MAILKKINIQTNTEATRLCASTPVVVLWYLGARLRFGALVGVEVYLRRIDKCQTNTRDCISRANSLQREYIEKDQLRTKLSIKIRQMKEVMGDFVSWYKKVPLEVSLESLEQFERWIDNYFAEERTPDWYRKQAALPYIEEICEEHVAAWKTNAHVAYKYIEQLIEKTQQQKNSLVLPQPTLTYREWKKVPRSERATP